MNGPWYVVTVTWKSGRTHRHTTDNADLALGYVAAHTVSPHRALIYSIYAEKVTEEPPEERAKREAWETYRNG